MGGPPYDYSSLTTSELMMRYYSMLRTLTVSVLLVGCSPFAPQGGLKVKEVAEAEIHA